MAINVTLAELAAEIGLDRSTIRKYVLKHGFAPVTIRSANSRGQVTLALSIEDAESVRQLRQAQGFGVANGEPIETGVGFFYVVQLIPELDPCRLKLGFTNGIDGRVAAHRTAAPTAILLKSWPCRKAWEIAAIASATRIESMSLSNEVFACEDVARLIERTDAFFALMPAA